MYHKTMAFFKRDNEIKAYVVPMIKRSIILLMVIMAIAHYQNIQQFKEVEAHHQVLMSNLAKLTVRAEILASEVESNENVISEFKRVYFDLDHKREQELNEIEKLYTEEKLQLQIQDIVDKNVESLEGK